ncbi:MAG: type 4a pilus biogenesis protein PilO [Rickettsiales bacterium]|nr:type 4a pilus biogenesis protein PilO [Rickettsiales bacterium]
MAMDLNADVGELLKQWLRQENKKAASAKAPTVALDKKKHAISLKRYYYVMAVFAGMMALLATYVGAYAIPQWNANAKLEQRRMVLQEQQDGLGLLENNERTLSRKMEQSLPEYRTLLGAFDTEEDMDRLYQSISSLAAAYDLKITQIKHNTLTPHAKIKAVGEVAIDLNLSGGFTQYMAFKKQLADERPLLDIRSEVLQVGQDATTPGKLHIRMTLTSYVIDKTPHYQILELYGEDTNNG